VFPAVRSVFPDGVVPLRPAEAALVEDALPIEVVDEGADTDDDAAEEVA
jgi:hypothetical protein